MSLDKRSSLPTLRLAPGDRALVGASAGGHTIRATREGIDGMRIIHTADWHLGRIFHGTHLTDDQAHVLEQFVMMVRDERPDLVMIAGDLYDRAVPPPDAVRLLDEVLHRITDMGVPVALIAGNHDSPDRLGFGARLLAPRGVHVSCLLEHGLEPLVMDDAFGRVHIHTLPFAEPPVVRAHLGDPTVRNHCRAMEALLDGVRARHPKGERAVIMAHATVVGGQEGDSERSLGAFPGSTAIPVEALNDFDFVALGHLHPRQTLGRGHVHYPGALLKYSFGEVDHDNAISLVELGAPGTPVTIEALHLSPRRQVRKIRGYLEDLLRADEGGSREDYLGAVLYDDGAVLDPLGRLREVYPNIMSIERLCRDMPERVERRPDHRSRKPMDLFHDFFREVTGLEMTEDESTTMADVLLEMDMAERESSAPMAPGAEVRA